MRDSGTIGVVVVGVGSSHSGGDRLLLSSRLARKNIPDWVTLSTPVWSAHRDAWGSRRWCLHSGNTHVSRHVPCALLRLRCRPVPDPKRDI